MQYLIECAIFDDGDEVPTLVLGTWAPLELYPMSEQSHYDDLMDDLRPLLHEMREVAEEDYGSKAPNHAVFWSCWPEPDHA